MQNFISKSLGQRFIEPQTTDLSEIFKESSPTTPLIFVLSTGTDPAAELYKFADKMKFSKRMLSISLGQGQGPRAEKMIEGALEVGSWVFFQVTYLECWVLVFCRYFVTELSFISKLDAASRTLNRANPAGCCASRF